MQVRISRGRTLITRNPPPHRGRPGTIGRTGRRDRLCPVQSIRFGPAAGCTALHTRDRPTTHWSGSTLPTPHRHDLHHARQTWRPRRAAGTVPVGCPPRSGAGPGRDDRAGSHQRSSVPRRSNGDRRIGGGSRLATRHRPARDDLPRHGHPDGGHRESVRRCGARHRR